MSRKKKIEQEAIENKELSTVSMFQLEDRVLFDGAAVADVVAAAQQAQAEIAEAQDADHSADHNADDNDGNSDSKSNITHADDASHGSFSDYLEVAASGNIAVQTALEASTQIKVLFVADMEGADALAAGADDYNIIISFDSDSTTSAQLLDALNSALEGGKADAIGFMVDPATEGAMEAFNSEAGSAQFWDGVNNALNAQGSINLFGDADDTNAAEAISADYDRTVTVNNLDDSGKWNTVSTVDGSDLGDDLNDSVNLDDTLFEQDFLDSLDMLSDNPDDVRSVAFISRDINNLDTIIDGLGDDVDIVILDPSQDALQQITDYLNDTTDVHYSSLNFFAPGSTDALDFNGESISADDLSDFSNEIVSWRNAMTDHASINIYGGDMTATESGRDFLDHLMAATGADVEVSDAFAGLDMAFVPDHDPTALNHSAAEVLDYAYNIERAPHTYYVVNGDDSGEGSLRWALEQANQDVGLDYIEFQLDDGTEINIDSGSLYITDSVIINSSGLNITVDGSALSDSLFVVDDGNDSNQIQVEVHNMNINGASADGVENTLGGAIQNHEALNLNGVIIQNSEAQQGGAIWNDVDAKLVIESSKFIGNSALEGGAIYNNGGEVYINDSYFSDNVALDGAAVSSVNTDTSTAYLEINDSAFDGNINIGEHASTIYSEGVSIQTGIDLLNDSTLDLNLSEGNNVIFINSDTKGLDTILSQIGDNAKVVLFDGKGFDQITEYLKNNQGFDAIHLITHGDIGSVAMGEQLMDMDFLEANQSSLEIWGNALKSGGDILIYGCSTAQDGIGQAFVQALAAMTGADVAASTNKTGIAGDWDLEYRVGNIDTASYGFLNYEYNLQQYVFTVWDTGDKLPTGPWSDIFANYSSYKFTMREAVWLANQHYAAEGEAAGDTYFIKFTSAANISAYMVDDLARPDISDPNLSMFNDVTYTVILEYGQLTLNSPITIDGQVSRSPAPPTAITIISGTWDDLGNFSLSDNRQFYVMGGSTEVTLYNLTLMLGDETGTGTGITGKGGSIYNEGVTNLKNVNFFLNTAAQGGAIFSAGILNIYTEDSTVIYNEIAQQYFDTNGISYSGWGSGIRQAAFGNNSATQDGGAIYVTGTGEFNIWPSGVATTSSTTVPVRFSANHAGNNGGAIYYTGQDNTDSFMRVYYTEFIRNVAENGNGGAIYATNAKGSSDIYGCSFGGTTFDLASSGNVLLDGNTALHGNGGAIYFSQGGDLRLEWDFFVGNQAINGGGVYFNDSNSLIMATDWEVVNEDENFVRGNTNKPNPGFFYLNFASENGGAVYTSGVGDVIVDYYIFSGNGIRVGSYSLFGYDIPEINGITENGGALYLNNSGSVWMREADMTYNYASNNGGAVYTSSNVTSVTVLDSGINHNAAGSGAGLYVAGDGDLTIISSTFALQSETLGLNLNFSGELTPSGLLTNNGNGDGFYYAGTGDVVINASTFAYNKAGDFALPNAGSLEVINNIIMDAINIGSAEIVDSTNNIFANMGNYTGAHVDAIYVDGSLVSKGLTDGKYVKVTVDTADPNVKDSGVKDGSDNFIGRSVTIDTETINGIGFIARNLYLDSEVAYHANYRTGSLAILVKESIALGAGAISLTERSYNPVTGKYETPADQPRRIDFATEAEYIAALKLHAQYLAYRYDQRGNIRYGESSIAIGAFEPIFSITVDNAGDDSGLAYTGDRNAQYFDEAMSSGGGLTLREATYWMDTYDTDYIDNYVLNTGSNAVDVNTERYVHFDENAMEAAGYTISLTNGDIRIGGTFFGASNTIKNIRISTTPGDVWGSDWTYTGAEAENRLKVDAGDKSRHFYINENSVVEINNLTLQNGYVSGPDATGGSIHLAGTLTTNNVVFLDNYVDNAVIFSNTAQGGALYISDTGSATIIDTTFSGNEARSTTASPYTSYSTALGGAIYNAGTLLLVRSTLSDNIVSTVNANLSMDAAKGGGLYNVGDATIISSTLFGNIARSNSVALTGDSADNAGGSAIYMAGGTVNLYYSTVMYNIGQVHQDTTKPGDTTKAGIGDFSAIYLMNGTFNISNSIVGMNSLQRGTGANMRTFLSDIHTGLAADVTIGNEYKNNNIIVAYNEATGTEGFDWKSLSVASQIGGYTEAQIVISGAYTDVAENMYNYLSYNGGKTQSVRLKDESWALNNGNAILIADLNEYLKYDQRGLERQGQVDRAGNDVFSLGAYQALLKVYVTSTATDSGSDVPTSDGFDFTTNRPGFWSNHVTLRDALYWIDPEGTIEVRFEVGTRDAQGQLIEFSSQWVLSGKQLSLVVGADIDGEIKYFNYVGSNDMKVLIDYSKKGAYFWQVDDYSSDGKYVQYDSFRSLYYYLDANGDHVYLKLENYDPSAVIVVEVEEYGAVRYRFYEGTVDGNTVRLFYDGTSYSYFTDYATGTSVIENVYAVVAFEGNTTQAETDTSAQSYSIEQNMDINADNLSRVLYINNGRDTIVDVNISNMSFRNGMSLRSNYIGTVSYVSAGGGIFATENIALYNVSILDCTTDSFGGGLYVMNGSVTLGSAVGNGSGMDFQPVVISGNRAIGSSSVQDSGSGGGIYLTGVKAVEMNAVSVDSNTAQNAGGGIFIQAADSVVINYSNITFNTAENYDGGGLVLISADAEMLNTTISNNQAGNYGGGIRTTSDLTMDFVTIANNAAMNNGGGIYQSSGSTTITNSILAQNWLGTETQPLSQGITNPTMSDFYGTNSVTLTMDYSVYGTLSVTNKSISHSARVVLVNGQVVSESSPTLLLDLSEVADANGGPTLTVYVGAQSFLKDESVVKVDPASTVEYDQRGKSRTADLPNGSHVIKTVGAYQRREMVYYFVESEKTGDDYLATDARNWWEDINDPSTKLASTPNGFDFSINGDYRFIIMNNTTATVSEAAQWIVNEYSNVIVAGYGALILNNTTRAKVSVSESTSTLAVNSSFGTYGEKISNYGTITFNENSSLLDVLTVRQNNGSTLTLNVDNTSWSRLSLEISNPGNGNSNTVEYIYNGNQNVLAANYDTLILNYGTKKNVGDLSAITLNMGFDSEAASLSLTGTMKVRDLMEGEGTVIYNRSDDGQIVATTYTGAGGGSLDYYNLVLIGGDKTATGNLSANSLTFPGAGKLTLDGDLTLQTLNAGSSTIILNNSSATGVQNINGNLVFNELWLIGQGERNFDGTLETTGNLYVLASLDGTVDGSGDGAVISVSLASDLTVGGNMTMGKAGQTISGTANMVLLNGDVDITGALSMNGIASLRAQTTDSTRGNVTVHSLGLGGTEFGDMQRLALHGALTITGDMINDVSLQSYSYIIYDGAGAQDVIALNYMNVVAGGSGIKSWTNDNGRYGNIQDKLIIEAGSTFWTDQVLRSGGYIGEDTLVYNRLENLVIEGSPDASSPGGNLYLAGADVDGHAIGSLFGVVMNPGAVITYGGSEAQIVEQAGSGWDYSKATLVFTDSNTKTYEGDLTVGNLVILSNDVTGVVTGDLTINGVDPTDPTVTYASGALWFRNNDEADTEGTLEIGGNLLTTDYFDFKAGHGTMHFNGDGDDFSQTVNNLTYWNLKISNADKVLDNQNVTTVANEFIFDGGASLLIQGQDLSVNILSHNAGNLSQYFIFNDGTAGTLGTGGKLLFSVDAGTNRQIAAGSGNINGSYWNELWFQNGNSSAADIKLIVLPWNDFTANSENYIKQQFSIESTSVLSFDAKGSNAVGRYYSDYFKALFAGADTSWTQVNGWYAIDGYRGLPTESGTFAFGTADLSGIKSSGYDPLVVTESGDWNYYVSDPALGYVSQIGTLRFAVEYANIMDGLQTVTFEVNQVNLGYGELRIKDHLILGSMDKVGTLINVASGTQRIFVIANSERDIYVKIIGLDLTGGDATDVNTIDGVANVNGGGAIYNEESLELVRVNVYGNIGIYGGGLYNAAGGNILITDSSFTDNTAAVGGAIYNNSAMKVTTSTDTNNNVTVTTELNAGEILIYRSLFANNTAIGDALLDLDALGGAIYSNFGVVYADNSTFTGNSGQSIVHHAAYREEGMTVEEIKTANEDTGMTFAHITFALNNIGTDGYGIVLEAGNLFVESSILTYNTDAVSAIYYNPATGTVISTNNHQGIDDSGMFKYGGALYDAGGWTKTLVLDETNSLVQNNILDQADGMYETDQRGYLVYNQKRDLGAFEYKGGLARNLSLGVTYSSLSELAGARAGNQIELVGSRIKFDGLDLTFSSDIVLTGAESGMTFIDGGNGGGSITIGNGSSSVLANFSGINFYNFVLDAGKALFNVANNGTLVIEQSVFQNISGGTAVIAVSVGGLAYMDRVEFVFNSGTMAGAIYNNGGTVIAERSTFRDNTSIGNGGAITSLNGTLKLSSSSVYRNTAVDGAGVYVDGGSLEMLNTTIAFNIGSGQGTALYYNGENLILTNNTFAYSKVTGGNVAVYLTGNNASLTNNLFLSSLDYSGLNNMTGFNNLLAVNREDRYLADRMMMDNGGYVKTLALVAGTDAIDGGYAGGTISDARGYDATVSKTTGETRRDIGAYEFDGYIGYYYQYYEVAAVEGTISRDSSRWVGFSSFDDSLLATAYSNAGKDQLYIKLVNSRITESNIELNMTAYINQTNVVRTVYIYGSEEGDSVIDAKHESQIFTIKGLRYTSADKTLYMMGNLIVQRVGLVNGFVDGNGAVIGQDFSSYSKIGGTTNGSITFTETTMQGNVATGSGGAIWASGTKDASNAVYTINSSLLTGNVALGDGGAIANEGAVTLTNSTVSNNIAFGDGGGISVNKFGENSATSLTISGSTIAFNNAFGHGGGLYNGSTVTLVENSILARNRSTDLIHEADFSNTGGFTSDYSKLLSVYESGFDYYNAPGSDGKLSKLNAKNNNIVEYQNGHTVNKHPNADKDSKIENVTDFFGQVTWVQKSDGTYELRNTSSDVVKIGIANSKSGDFLFVDGVLRDNGGWSYTLATQEGNIGMDMGSGSANDQRGYLVNSPSSVTTKDIGAFEWSGGVARIGDNTYSSWSAAMSAAANLGTATVELVNSRIIGYGASISKSGMNITVKTIGDSPTLYQLAMIDGMSRGRILTLNSMNSSLTISNVMMQNGFSVSSSSSPDNGGQGGAIYSNGTLSLNDVSVFSSFASIGGGAVYASNVLNIHTDGVRLSSVSHEKIKTGSRFSYNRTLGSGGAVYMTSGVLNTTTITDERDRYRTSFTANNADENGGAIYFIQSSGASSIQGVNFNDNNALNGGAFYSESANDITFRRATFTNNIARDNGGAVYGSIDAQLAMHSVNMYYNAALSGDGGAVYLTSSQGLGSFVFYVPDNTENSSIRLNYGYIENNVAANGNGGAFYFNNLHGDAEYIDMDESEDRSSGASILFYTGGLNVSVSASRNYAGVNGGAIYAYDTGNVYLSRENSVVGFGSNTAVQNGGAVYLEKIGDFKAENNVYFEYNIAGEYGGAVYMIDSENSSIIFGSNVSFYGNGSGTDQFGVSRNTVRGGAMYVYNIGDIVMDYTAFSSNDATEYGGAVYLESIGDVTLSRTDFYANAAWAYSSTESSGGAMYIVNTRNSTVTISRSSFEYNQANLVSAIYLDQGTLNINNSTFYANNNYENAATVLLVSGAMNLVNVTSSQNYSSWFSTTFAFKVDNGSFSIYNSLIDDDYGIKLGTDVNVNGSANNIFSKYYLYADSRLVSGDYRVIGAYRPDGSYVNSTAGILDSNGNIVGVNAGQAYFITSNLFLAETPRQQGDRLTYSLAIDGANSLAYRYNLGGNEVRSGSTAYMIGGYDQRGNIRTGLEVKVIDGMVYYSFYAWDENTQSYIHRVVSEDGVLVTDTAVTGQFKAMSVSIGAFEGNFYMTVTSNGDSALEHHPDLILHNDNEWAYIDIALAEGITLREAVYWIDSYDFTQLQGLDDYDVNRARFDADRYVKFADSMFTDEKRTINLIGGDIVIDTDVIIGSYEKFAENYNLYYMSGDGEYMYFENDNTFRMQDNGQIVIDAHKNSRIFQNDGRLVGINNMTLINGAVYNDHGRYSFSADETYTYEWNSETNQWDYIFIPGTIGRGGAILNVGGGTMIINNSMIRDSLATNDRPGSDTTRTAISIYVDGRDMGQGGGIYNDQSSMMEINSSTITANTADGSKMGNKNYSNAAENAGLGGGIYNAGTMTISNSLIGAEGKSYEGGSAQGNWAIGNTIDDPTGKNSGGGGGIYTTGNLTVNNSTISGNSLKTSRVISGSAIAAQGGTVTLNGNTIVNNDTFYKNATTYGAAILIDSQVTHFTMTNNIIAENYVSGGSDQRRLDITIKIGAGSVTENNNIVGSWKTVGDNFDFLTDSSATDILGTGGSVDNLNLDTDLLYNGGLTRNYRVEDGSVAIGGGNYGADGGVDQRGLMADSATGQKRETIGAYERLTYVSMDSAVDRGEGLVAMTDQALVNGDVYYDFTANQHGWQTTLRYAIHLTDSNGVIDINVVTDPVTGNPYDSMKVTEGEMVIRSGLTIEALNQSFTLDADNLSRHFYMDSTSMAVVVNLSNLILNNGMASGSTAREANGGSILAANSNLTLNLNNVQIKNARAEGSGGAIYFGGSKLNVYRSSITESKAGVSGGAVYIAIANNADFIESVMLNNQAGKDGGSIYFGGQQLYLESTVIGTIDQDVNFVNAQRGGAIYVGGGDLSMLNSTLSNNYASDKGGAIYFTNSVGSITLDFVTIANNYAGSTGGGMYLNSYSTINVTNSIIAQNWQDNVRNDIYAINARPSNSSFVSNVIGVTNLQIIYTEDNNVILGNDESKYGWLYGTLSVVDVVDGDGRQTYIVDMDDNPYAIGRAEDPGDVRYDQAGQGRPSSNATAGAYEKNPEPVYTDIYMFFGTVDSDINNYLNWQRWDGDSWETITSIDFTGDGKIFTFNSEHAANYTITQSWDIEDNKVVLNWEGQGDTNITITNSEVAARFEVNGTSSLYIATVTSEVVLLAVSTDSTIGYTADAEQDVLAVTRSNFYGNLVLSGAAKTSDVALTVKGDLDIGDVNLTVTSGDLTVEGNVVANGGSLDVQGDISALNITSSSVSFGGLNAGGDIALDSSGAVSVDGNVTSGGLVNISADGNINLSNGQMTGTDGVNVSGNALNLASYELGTAGQGVNSLTVSAINALSGVNTINHFLSSDAQVTVPMSIASGAGLYYNIGDADTSIGMADGGNMFNLENISNDGGTFGVVTKGDATLNDIQAGELLDFSGVLSVTCEDVNLEGDNNFMDGNIDLVLNNSGWFNLSGTFGVKNDFSVNKIRITGTGSDAQLTSANGSVSVLNEVMAEDSTSNFTVTALNGDVQIGSVSNLNELTVNSQNIVLQNSDPAAALLINVGKATFNTTGSAVALDGTIIAASDVSFTKGVNVVGNSAITAGGSIDFGTAGSITGEAGAGLTLTSGNQIEAESIDMPGNLTVNGSLNVAQNIDSVGNLTINNGLLSVIGGNADVNGDLTVGQGAEFSAVNTNLGGSMNLVRGASVTTDTLTLNGTATQTLNMYGTSNISTLVLDNASAMAVLNGDLTVDTFTFSDHNAQQFMINNNSTLMVADGIENAGWSNYFVMGSKAMLKQVAGSVVDPLEFWVGSTTGVSMIALSNGIVAGQAYGVGFENSITNDGDPITGSLEDTVKATWSISGGSGFDVSVAWNEGLNGNNFNYENAVYNLWVSGTWEQGKTLLDIQENSYIYTTTINGLGASTFSITNFGVDLSDPYGPAPINSSRWQDEQRKFGPFIINVPPSVGEASWIAMQEYLQSRMLTNPLGVTSSPEQTSLESDPRRARRITVFGTPDGAYGVMGNEFANEVHYIEEEKVFEEDVLEKLLQEYVDDGEVPQQVFVKHPGTMNDIDRAIEELLS